MKRSKFIKAGKAILSSRAFPLILIASLIFLVILLPAGSLIGIATNTTLPDDPGYHDFTAPNSGCSILPIPNAEGWNNEIVEISIYAMDNLGGSGVKEIHYSADNGSTWAIYISAQL